MRNLKKFLALVLALMMAMSLMVTANAATQNVEFPDDYAADPAFEEAIDVLGGMGVFKGDEKGNFNPGASITRAETAAIIYRLITADVDDSKADLYRNIDHPFIDVTPDKWYAGYVGYLWSSGIIKGTNTAGTVFDPAGPVTGYQALAMILRAVGYDKNHEFEGSQWIYNISLIANNKGILNDVNKTNYGAAMLHNAARRDVVASLLFRTAAYVPQVVYTSAFQYQEYGMSDNANNTNNNSLIGGNLNPTLGQTWFGLTVNHGVVLGNEATGEGENVTKIGFSWSTSTTGSSTQITGWTPVYQDDNPSTGVIVGWQPSGFSTIPGSTRWGGITDNVSANSNIGNAYQYNNALDFKWDTGLDLFGHAVKVWYDARDTSKRDTYAMYDEVVATAVVTAADANLATGGALRAAATNSSTDTLSNNWTAPGLSIRSDSSAYFNYSFGAMDATDYTTELQDSTGAAVTSPIKTNNGDNTNGTDATWPLYLLISNNSSKNVDMVVALDLTFSRITQLNNTVSTKTVGVLNSNGANDATGAAHSTNGYFGDANDNGVRGDSLDGTTLSYVSLAQKNLVKSPKTDLGTKVAAIEITGTKGGRVEDKLFGAAPGTPGEWEVNGMASAGTNLSSTFYYQLTEPSHVVPGTVVKIDRANQTVYLSDGSTLKKSILSEAVDAHFTKNVDAPQVYSTYSFTLDNEGRYIYYEETRNASTFVYGTYIDYVTELASSSFTYPMVYVDTNGERGQANITKMDGNVMDIDMYGGSKLNKRDSTTWGSSGASSGYLKGMYVGYSLSEDGALTEVTTASNSTGFVRSDGTEFGTSPITIGSRDVAIGSIETNLPNLFLTGNTQFYIVDGAGTANQKVTAYKGLTELTKGMSEVTIDATINAAGGRLYGDGDPSRRGGGTTYLTDLYPIFGGLRNGVVAATGDWVPSDLIYYSLGNFDYAQNYDRSAREIKTIYIPADLIKFTPAVDSSLFFVGDSGSQIINAYGKSATLFTMYQNGQEVQRWISGLYNDSSVSGVGQNSDSYIINRNGDNVFYTLIPTSDKAVNGETIYNIAEVKNADSKLIGEYYNVSNKTISTDWTHIVGDSAGVAKFNDGTNGTPVYTPTTYSTQIGYISDGHNRILVGDGGTVHYNDLYNVGSAQVQNLNDNYTIESLSDLNDAGSLANNYGLEVSCVLSTDDSTGMTISYIYVNYQP